MDIAAGLAAQQSILRQNIALSVIKASAQSDQAIAQILDQAVRSAPVAGARGSNFSSFA